MFWMRWMQRFFLEHSEDSYVIILFYGFKYLFLTRSNTHFEARFSPVSFFSITGL